MNFIRLVKIDLYMNHLVSHLLPLFCYRGKKEEKRKKKKKEKKNQDSTPRPLWSQCKIPVNYLEEKWSRGLWASV